MALEHFSEHPQCAGLGDRTETRTLDPFIIQVLLFIDRLVHYTTDAPVHTEGSGFESSVSSTAPRMFLMHVQVPSCRLQLVPV